MKKRILCLALVGLLTIGLLPATVLAAEEPAIATETLEEELEDVEESSEADLEGDRGLLEGAPEENQEVDRSSYVAPVGKTGLVYNNGKQVLIESAGCYINRLGVETPLLYSLDRENWVSDINKILGQDAGTYKIYYVPQYYWAVVKAASIEVTIAKQEVALTWDYTEPFTFNNRFHSVNVVDGKELVVVKNNAARNAGTYTAEAALKEGLDKNYVLAEGTDTQEFVINKLAVTLAWTGDSFVYNFQKHIPEASISKEIKLPRGQYLGVFVKGAQTNVGEYTAEAALYGIYGTDPKNYELTNPTFDFEITPWIIDVVWDEETEYLYDGEEHGPQCSFADKRSAKFFDLSVEGSEKLVGEYVAKAAISSKARYIDAANFALSNPTCDFVIKAHDYKFIEGMGQRVSKENTKDATFKTNGDIKFFTGVLVNGKELSKDAYTAKAGSTYITLNKAYLSKLPVGKYTLTAVYEDGSCETTFTVAAEAAKTGDSSNTATWLIIVALAALAAGLSVYSRKRSR